MESGIDYKGLLFAYDEASLSIYAFQGETAKVSFSSAFTGTDYVVKFLQWRNDLYALVNDGRLLVLDHMNSGTTDTWVEVTDTSDTVSDMVNWQDNIMIIGKTSIYNWSGSALTTIDAIPSGKNFYCAISVEDKVFLYGDDSTNQVVYSYDGNSTFTEIWTSSGSGVMSDYSFYNVDGKPHLVEWNGVLYFTWVFSSLYMILGSIDISTSKYSGINEIAALEITGVCTSMIIDNDMILMSTYESNPGIDNSNVYVHVLDDYKQEEFLQSGTGQKNGHLYRVESDPIMPSQHDKERLVYYPIYTVMGHVGGSVQPVFKYGNRLECYTDFNDVSGLLDINLKDVVDHICNLLDSYVLVRPENIAEVDMKGMVGRSDKLLTFSDDEGYGDLQMNELQDYVQGVNNFRRVAISWNNSILGDGVEIIGVPGILSVDEYSFDSPLVNSPVLAKNIATYIFNNMFSSDLLTYTCEYAPFIRVNDNVGIKAIGSHMYIDPNKEFKVVQVQHGWNKKFTKLVVAERKLIFNTLEI